MFPIFDGRHQRSMYAHMFVHMYSTYICVNRYLYIRGVLTSNTDDPNKRITVIVRTVSVFNFYQYGFLVILMYFSPRFTSARAPRRSSPPCHLLHPLQLLLRGLLGMGEASQLALHPQPLTNIENVV